MLATSMMLGGRPVYDITLPSNRSQWQKSVDGTQVPSNIQVLLILRINNVIEIQSNSTSIGAIHLDALANGSEVQIINLGYLLGRGGAGATGGNGGQGGNPGGTAGAAVRADFTGLLNITNGSGNIWGGGGGGGGGGTQTSWCIAGGITPSGCIFSQWHSTGNGLPSTLAARARSMLQKPLRQHSPNGSMTTTPRESMTYGLSRGSVILMSFCWARLMPETVISAAAARPSLMNFI